MCHCLTAPQEGVWYGIMIKCWKGRSERLAALLTSVVILTCLVLQSVATFRIFCPPINLFPSLSSFRIFCAPALYPFLDYPLYAPPHYEGESIGQPLVFGWSEEMTEWPVVPLDLGVSSYKLERAFLSALKGDHAGVHKYLDLYQQRYGKKLVGFRLESQSLVLSNDGIKPGPRTVLGSFSVESLGMP
jgi:hypothetical protein